MTKQGTAGGKIWTAFLWVLLGLAALRLALYAQAVVSFPYQAEMREGATVRSAMALSQGRDPWAPENAVQDLNVHGLMEPWVAAKVLGTHVGDVRAHRGLAVAVLLVGAGVAGAAFASLGAGALASSAGALAWLGANFFFIGLTARNDAFAAVLFLLPMTLGLIVPGRPGLALAVIAAALAPFSKAYTALAGALLVVGLWTEGRRRQAVHAGLALGVLFGSLAWAVHRSHPFYWSAVMQGGTLDAPPHWLWTQVKDFVVRDAWPLLLLAVALGPRAWSLPRSRAVLLQTLIALGLLVGWLGWNAGAYLQYFNQMAQPLLLLLVMAVPCEGWQARTREGLVVLAALLAVGMGTSMLYRFEPRTWKAWQDMSARVEGAPAPLAPPLFTLLYTAVGKDLPDNGHVSGAANRPTAPFLGAPILEAYRQQMADWHRRLSRGQLDPVILPVSEPPAPGDDAPWTADLGLYQEVDQFCLPVPLDFTGYECFRLLRPRAALFPVPHRGVK